MRPQHTEQKQHIAKAPHLKTPIYPSTSIISNVKTAPRSIPQTFSSFLPQKAKPQDFVPSILKAKTKALQEQQPQANDDKNLAPYSLFAPEKLGVDLHELQDSIMNDPYASFLIGFTQYQGRGICELINSERFQQSLCLGSDLINALFPVNSDSETSLDGALRITAKTRQYFRKYAILRATQRKIADLALAKFGFSRAKEKIYCSNAINSRTMPWLQKNMEGASQRKLLLQIVKSLALVSNLTLAKNLCQTLSSVLAECELNDEAEHFKKWETELDLVDKKLENKKTAAEQKTKEISESEISKAATIKEAPIVAQPRPSIIEKPRAPIIQIGVGNLIKIVISASTEKKVQTPITPLPELRSAAIENIGSIVLPSETAPSKTEEAVEISDALSEKDTLQQAETKTVSPSIPIPASEKRMFSKQSSVVTEPASQAPPSTVLVDKEPILADREILVPAKTDMDEAIDDKLQEKREITTKATLVEAKEGITASPQIAVELPLISDETQQESKSAIASTKAVEAVEISEAEENPIQAMVDVPLIFETEQSSSIEPTEVKAKVPFISLPVISDKIRQKFDPAIEELDLVDKQGSNTKALQIGLNTSISFVPLSAVPFSKLSDAARIENQESPFFVPKNNYSPKTYTLQHKGAKKTQWRKLEKEAKAQAKPIAATVSEVKAADSFYQEPISQENENWSLSPLLKEAKHKRALSLKILDKSSQAFIEIPKQPKDKQPQGSALEPISEIIDPSPALPSYKELLKSFIQKNHYVQASFAPEKAAKTSSPSLEPQKKSPVKTLGESLRQVREIDENKIFDLADFRDDAIEAFEQAEDDANNPYKVFIPQTPSSVIKTLGSTADEDKLQVKLPKDKTKASDKKISLHESLFLSEQLNVHSGKNIFSTSPSMEIGVILSQIRKRASLVDDEQGLQQAKDMAERIKKNELMQKSLDLLPKEMTGKDDEIVAQNLFEYLNTLTPEEKKDQEDRQRLLSEILIQSEPVTKLRKKRSLKLKKEKIAITTARPIALTEQGQEKLTQFTAIALKHNTNIEAAKYDIQVFKLNLQIELTAKEKATIESSIKNKEKIIESSQRVLRSYHKDLPKISAHFIIEPMHMLMEIKLHTLYNLKAKLTEDQKSIKQAINSIAQHLNANLDAATRAKLQSIANIKEAELALRAEQLLSINNSIEEIEDLKKIRP